MGCDGKRGERGKAVIADVVGAADPSRQSQGGANTSWGQPEPQDNPSRAGGSECTPRTSQQQLDDEVVWRRVGAAGPHVRVEDGENTLFPRHSVLPSLPPSLLAELRLGK